MIWAFVQQIVMSVPWGDSPASDEMLIVILIVFGILPAVPPLGQPERDGNARPPHGTFLPLPTEVPHHWPG